MIHKQTLIHCALMPEARPLIGRWKLFKKSPYLFEDDETVLVVGGIGKEKTILTLEAIFQTYTFNKALNIGICGCKDPSIPLGTLVCTNHSLSGILQETLQSVDVPVSNPTLVDATLVDMEAEAFLHITQKHIDANAVFVFKVISDHLNTTVPNKGYVSGLIQHHLSKIAPYV